MDNNMDDFFKKQFNRFDEPTEDWEKPDAGDWEAIASRVPMFNKTTFWTGANVGLMTLSAVLVSSLIYVWVLKKEITVLEKTVEVQQEQMEEVQQSIQIIEKRYVQGQKVIQNMEAENANLQQQHQAIITQNQLLNNITTQQKQVIANVLTVLDSLKTSASTNFTFNEKGTNPAIEPIENKMPMVNAENKITSKSNESITNNPKNLSLAAEPAGKAKAEKTMNNNINQLMAKEEEEIVIKELDVLSLSKLSVVNPNPTFFEPNLLGLNNENESNKSSKPIIKLPNISWNGVEVGYEYRFQVMDFSSTLNIIELETESDNFRTKNRFVSLHGLTLGIPLKNNWSIQTGVRFSNGDLDYKQEAMSIYDSANEYTLPDGTIVKSLNIEQETPFSKTNTTVQLLFDANDRLADNEEFQWETYGQQGQRTIQIPLGINYEIGIKKWRLLAGVGVQWNRIKLGEVDYRMDFDNQNQQFQTLTSDTETQSNISNFKYFSTFATTGLQYQFTQKWSAQATVGYNYHFWNNQPIDKWGNSDKFAAVGLKYTF